MVLDPCQLNGPLETTCFLSDESGQRLDPLSDNAIICEEIVQQNGRKNVSILLPTGETVDLQKVFVLKRGFIVVEISGSNGSCTTAPIPFAIEEEIILCAPEGTELQCEVTKFNCFSNVICDANQMLRELNVFIEICQSIKMTADVVIDVNASFCAPREQITRTCRSFSIPPQCPDIFNQDHVDIQKESAKPELKNEVAVPIRQLESLCVNTEKVYDWVTLQAKKKISLNRNQIIFNCTPTHILAPGGENNGAAIDNVDDYFCQTDTWVARSNLLVVREAHAGGLLPNGMVIVSHGFSPSAFTGIDTAEFYNPATDTWTAAPAANVPRGSVGGDVLNGLFYVVGGSDGNGSNVLDTVEVFNPASNTWALGTALPSPRSELAVVALNGELHAIAGFDGTNDIADHDVFDPNTNMWTSRAPLPQPLAFIAAEAFQGKIYVFGGRDPSFAPMNSTSFLYDPLNPTAPTNNVYIYDPATDSWSTGAPMPTSRWAAAACVCGSEIFVMGGFTPPNSYLTVVEAYNPVTNTWRTVASMPNARAVFPCISL
ncbi:BMQ_0737 family morphogenetic spore coat protein [Falsibacillus albus]|nr:kelch repeat-containing protein [Falsibacillus albus]